MCVILKYMDKILEIEIYSGDGADAISVSFLFLQEQVGASVNIWAKT